MATAHKIYLLPPWLQNIAKGTTDPRVEFISQVIKQILTKQFQNFDKALTSKSQPNISFLTKLKLKILALDLES